MADVNSSGVGNPRSVPHWLEEVTGEALGGRIEVICCLAKAVKPELVLEEGCVYGSIGWSQEQVFWNLCPEEQIPSTQLI